MGDLLSTPSTNPSDTPTQQATMSSTEASEISETNQTEKLTPESRTQHQTPELQQVSDPQMDNTKPVEDRESINSEAGDQEAEGEEEEEGECGFCLFMKAGGCRDSFIAWENCIEEAEKNKEDIVEKCFEVTGALKKCMEAHSDYYAPILQAEKAAEEEAVRELEKEKAKESSSNGSEERKGTEGSEQDRPVGSKNSEGS
ncbi:unnamed protein product [Thlaspi arvense]|uniref:GCK domain-containing protein n=1 Tax=Thlaspi arvense TaxID=13288 RepID=A0AAU9T1Z8_THLAR|nr:unnamed protein product [Thlaspi arvense]